MFIEQPSVFLRWIYPHAIWRMDHRQKAVYLTFDDGPSYYTSHLLDVLDKWVPETHWGDNFHHWDDDVIIGAANPLEFIEVVYWLRKGNWDGWCDLDIYPFKDNAKAAVEESVANVRAFESLLDYIGMSKMDELIAKDEPGCMVRTIREALFDFKSER